MATLRSMLQLAKNLKQLFVALLTGQDCLLISKKPSKWSATKWQESAPEMPMSQTIGTTSLDTPLLVSNDAISKWDERFLIMAFTIASWSKDPDCKVGAILVSPDKTKVSWGYNGLPRGIPDSIEVLEDKQEKNLLTVHAELNCLLNATETKGWTLYCTKPPCIKCALALIQAQVAKVVCMPLDQNSSWFLDQKKAKNLLIKSHVVVTETQF